MLEFVIVVESEADFRTATGIAERVFKECSPEWLEEVYLAEKFCWSGLEPAKQFICWKDIRHVAEQAKAEGYRQPKFFSRNAQLKNDAVNAKKILSLVDHFQKQRDIQAVIFIRDLDNQPERRKSLELACGDTGAEIVQTIVLGTADPNREAWVLNGFETEDDDEREELAKIQDEIKFNPCTESHRLRSSKTDTQENRSRNTKIVLERLTQGNFDREERCWIETDLDILREQGKQTGLAQFMDEVEERLLPLLIES